MASWYLRYQYRGRMLTIRELAEATGIPAQTLRKRLEILGWSIERTTTTPVRVTRRTFRAP